MESATADRACFRKTRKMNVKKVCTVLLLMFVATSIAVLVAKSLRPSTPNAATLNQRDRMIVYCFHGTDTCLACKNIEDYSVEAITAEFATEIADGRIEWEKLNFERPENRQFAKDFGLVAPCVVLVEMRGGAKKMEEPARSVGTCERQADLHCLHSARSTSVFGREVMELLPAVVEAFGLGIWTAVQPCPMATNVAAISYFGRRADSPRWVLLAGLLYALGQALAYVILAIALHGTLNAPRVSLFLQTYGNRLVGPVLVLLGMFFLDLLPVNWSKPAISEKMRKRVDILGIWAALPLGMFLAMAFCPVSAACFFISLFRLSASNGSLVILPSVYGLGIALPVVVLSVLVAFSAHAIGKAFHALAQTVWWMQRTAGVICLAVGIHHSLKYIFELPLF